MRPLRKVVLDKFCSQREIQVPEITKVPASSCFRVLARVTGAYGVHVFVHDGFVGEGVRNGERRVAAVEETTRVGAQLLCNLGAPTRKERAEVGHAALVCDKEVIAKPATRECMGRRGSTAF